MRADDGLSLNDLMAIVSKSKARNKVIILDSCFSGEVSERPDMPGYAAIYDGTTILAACGKDESASENNNHGVFTSLLVEALYGCSLDLF